MPEDTMNEDDIDRCSDCRAENLCQSKGVDCSLRQGFGSGRNDNERFKLLAFMFDLIFNLTLPGDILAECKGSPTQY